MVKHDELHLQARVCAIKCYYTALCKMSAAQQAFEVQWNGVHQDHKIKDTYKFIKHSVSKLEDEYDVHRCCGSWQASSVAI